MLEGPLGGGKGSWLVTARKSYVQYIIDRTANDPTIGFAFADAQGRVQYDLAKAWNASLSVMHGTSGLDRTRAENVLGINALFKSDYDFTLTTLALRYAPGSRLLATNRISLLRERYVNANREARRLGSSGYGEWAWNGDAAWQQSNGAALQFGGIARRLRDDGNVLRLGTGGAFTAIDAFRGTGMRSGVYAQQSWNPWRGRIRLTAGGSAGRHSVSGASAATPYASLGLQPASGTSVTFSWGQYAQFAELAQFFSLHGSRRLAPERATHVEAAVEQRLGERTRLRFQLYNRQDRDLIFRPLLDFRILNGRVQGGNLFAPFANSQRGYARGWQTFVQRRTANGFTGWIGYACGVSRVRDGVLRMSYPADFDQKHTVNVFGSYRLRPSVNLSVKWLYGSGFPLRGFFTQVQNDYFLATERNRLRIPPYQRSDFRVNKAFIRDKWQLTLFAEVINFTNRGNVRFDDINSIDGRTGRVRLRFDKMFPILPSAGIVVEF